MNTNAILDSIKRAAEWRTCSACVTKIAEVDKVAEHILAQLLQSCNLVGARLLLDAMPESVQTIDDVTYALIDVAMLLASKVEGSDDMTVGRCAKRLQITKQDVKNIELAFLEAIDWRVQQIPVAASSIS